MQLNDAVLAALGPGQYNEVLLAYYQDGGATSNQINDAEYQFLVAEGATPAHINDMWVQYLRDLGFEGALNDMLLEFWLGGGGGFSDLGEKSGVDPGVLVESRVAAPEFTGTITVTSGVGLISKNGDGTWAASIVMTPEDTYQAAVTSSPTYLGVVEVTVDLPDTFTVTTRAQDITPDLFVLIPVDDAPPETLIESNPPTITGMDPACPISIVDGEYEINQSDVWTSGPGTIDPASVVTVRRLSGGSEETVSCALTIGSVTRNFAITTRYVVPPEPGEAVNPDDSVMLNPDGSNAANPPDGSGYALDPDGEIMIDPDGNPVPEF